ncbi:hypothetical protein GCM10009624_31570 [Gordonia sinesedis]
MVGAVPAPIVRLRVMAQRERGRSGSRGNARRKGRAEAGRGGGRPGSEPGPKKPSEPVDAASSADDGGPTDGASADGAPESAPSWKNAWPFWVALIVVALAVVGLLLSYVWRPAEDRASDSAQVQFAINDVYTARNAVNYGDYRNGHCAADLAAPDFPSAEAFAAENRDSQKANGLIVIPEITDVTVTGDRATAQVQWHFDKQPDRKQTTSVSVARENGKWKVCKP